MRIAITGHRPNKLGNDYDLKSPLVKAIKRQILKELNLNPISIKELTLITGMALGIDQLFAQIAIENGIPFIAAVPFVGQHSVWPVASVNRYMEMLTKAEYVYVVDENRKLYSHEEAAFRDWLKSTENNYSPPLMQLRNEWMVKYCDKLIAVWDGTPGGTANCVLYARKMNKPIIYIDPKNIATFMEDRTS